ncbi:MAG: M48 family metalloprotease [Deltaproteobacteria bacterium]|nr:M48 family metalloprotease [Deltaproteobacteria bacterium]
MNTLRTTFLMALLTVLLVTAGGALGGEGGMMMAFVFALVMNGVSYWLSDKIVLRMYGAKEIGPEEAPKLHRIVQELTLRAQMPMPKLYLIPQEAPNAFATSLANALKKLQQAAERVPMEANPATAHMFIVNPLTGGGLMALFSTHPPIEERIRRLEEMSGRRG